MKEILGIILAVVILYFIFSDGLVATKTKNNEIYYVRNKDKHIATKKL